MLMKQYEFVNKIGKGTHGTTYLLKNNLTKNFLVCKSIPTKFKKHATREINVLKNTEHRRIVKMTDILYVEKGIYILMEYANYGTIESMLKYFAKNKIKASYNLIWSIAARVLDGLKHLHGKGIIHRDIKPANILISKTETSGKEHLEFKICDFSLSEQKDAIQDKCIVGTPYYMAPEIVAKEKYGNTVDIWALGVILYELVFGKKPFTGSDRENLYNNILYQEIEKELSIPEEPALELLIKECLKKTNRKCTKELLKIEKIKFTLTAIELKYREIQIEQLEEKIIQMESEKAKLAPTYK